MTYLFWSSYDSRCMVPIEGMVFNKYLSTCLLAKFLDVCSLGANHLAPDHSRQRCVKYILSFYLPKQGRFQLPGFPVPVCNLHDPGHNAMKRIQDLPWLISVQYEQTEWRAWEKLVTLADPHIAPSLLLHFSTRVATFAYQVCRKRVRAENLKCMTLNLAQAMCRDARLSRLATTLATLATTSVCPATFGKVIIFIMVPLHDEMQSNGC